MKKRKFFLTLLSTMAGLTFGGMVVKLLKDRNNSNIKDGKIERLSLYYDVLNRWLELRQNGGSLERYFLEQGYENIAIYGMGVLGNRLYDELKNTEVHVAYAVDKNVYGQLSLQLGLEIKLLNEQLEKVDAIIVTPIFAFDAIEEELREKIDCPIISLDDVLDMS